MSEAVSTLTSRGTLWSWPHLLEPFAGLAPKEFEVKNIEEKGIVVILAQDGLWGWNEKTDVGKKIRGDAKKLLEKRWKGVDLMEEIVSSPEFARGDFKASIEAAFSRVDVEVEKLVKQFDTSILNWKEPAVWRALYNSLVVVVTPTTLHFAGAGAFHVSVISSDAVDYLSPDTNFLSSSLKTCLSWGQFGNDDHELQCEMQIEQTVKAASGPWYHEMELESNDLCIAVELWSSYSFLGGREYVKHAGAEGEQDWGAALTGVASEAQRFHGVLLELKHPPQDPSPCLTGQVPAPVDAFQFPVVAQVSPSSKTGAGSSSTPLKKQTLLAWQPSAPLIVADA